MAALPTNQRAQPANTNNASESAEWLAVALQKIDHLRESKDIHGARTAVTEALARLPNSIDLRHRAALIEHQLGHLAEARASIEPLLQSPNATVRVFAAAAIIGRSQRDHNWVELIAREALRRWPSIADFHQHLGFILLDRRQTRMAAAHLEAAVNLQPYNTTAQIGLATAVERLGDLGRAELIYQQALAFDPRSGQALLNYGVILQKQNRLQEALQMYLRAAALPQPPILHSNLGALYRSLFRYGEAREAYRVALGHDPNNGSFLYNYGNFLKEVGELEAAAAAYKRALAVDPTNASVHWNLSLALLAGGKLHDGFNEYEWRWQYEGFPSKRRNFSQPMWDGRTCAEKTLLIHTEQGMGDVLQYMRFLPSIVERAGGGKIIFECHKPLMSLFAGLPGISDVVERLGSTPLPPFDLHLPLMSATYVLGIKELDQLPSQTPYIPVPETSRLPLADKRSDLLNIGLVWAGNPKFSGDRLRSTRFATVAPLLEVPGTRFFSLQKGEAEAELETAPPSLIQLGGQIDDFCDTAAAMMQLDLIVTTCTSVAHLAGALGRPTWVMLGHAPDWRWLLGRDDSPWYPNARLFRQARPNDWSSVVDQIKLALVEAVRAVQRGRPAL